MHIMHSMEHKRADGGVAWKAAGTTGRQSVLKAACIAGTERS